MVRGCCFSLGDYADQQVVRRCLPAVNFYLFYTLATHSERYSGSLYLIVDIIEKVGPVEEFFTSPRASSKGAGGK